MGGKRRISKVAGGKIIDSPSTSNSSDRAARNFNTIKLVSEMLSAFHA